MAAVNYSPAKVDLFFPARRGHFFEGISPDDESAICAEFCRLAYSRPEPSFSFDRTTINNALQAIDFSVAPDNFFESLNTPDGRGTHCFIAANDTKKVMLVAFRGTDASDHTDLQYDADALQQDWDRGGKVHKGFANAFGQVRGDLLPALAKPKYDNCRKIYAGHSLGAALATLLASIQKPDRLFTIGSPRVGDAAFVATLNGVNSTRYVDCSDLVTRVPPENVMGLLHYAHFGPMIYIDRKGAMPADADETFVRNDRLRAAAEYTVEYAWKPGNVGLRELADHTPFNYTEAIKANHRA
jgi:triacylglycerol lipase